MKPTLLLASLAIAAVASAAGQTYLEETFSDSHWENVSSFDLFVSLFYRLQLHRLHNT